jgi:hypothetical protein
MDKYVMGYLGTSSIIGIEDVIKIEDVEEFGQYQHRVQCITKEAEVMYLLKKDFMALKNQQNVWSMMTKMQKRQKDTMQKYKDKTDNARKHISNNITKIFNNIPQLNLDKVDINSLNSS